MKKIISICVGFILFLWAAMFLASCETPYQITETITKDSVGKEVHVITKTYSNGTTTVVPQASFNLVTHPYWDSFYGAPYYYSQPYFVPRIVVPINSNIHYRQSGRGRH
jgi:hypothetical protein